MDNDKKKHDSGSEQEMGNDTTKVMDEQGQDTDAKKNKHDEGADKIGKF